LPIMPSWRARWTGRGGLAALGVDYVALCTDRLQADSSDPATLRQRLLAGEQPRFLQGSFLQEIDLAGSDAIRIWKFLPEE
jgi:hypothetical protein